ncbi:MAG TPA: RDD family protein [Acidimicrobiales bacterium]|nr:RDD family protein [Acidimicrobiales bacterium]
MTARVDAERDLALQGRYAGAVTRLGAYLVDATAVTLLFAAGSATVQFVVRDVLGIDFDLADVAGLAAVAAVIWTFVYFAVPLAASGRTLGSAVWGLRVVRADGRDLDAAHAVLRTVAMPLSFLVFGLGLLLILVHPAQRALHDLIADTAVVYAWDARAARLRFMSRDA